MKYLVAFNLLIFSCLQGFAQFTLDLNSIDILPNTIYTSLADFNGDGYNDLVAASHNWDEDSNTLTGGVKMYLGQGDGTFEETDWLNEDEAFAISSGDVDNDGDVDFVITQPVALRTIYFRNDGDMNFTQITLGPELGYFFCELANFDADEELELITCDSENIYVSEFNGTDFDAPFQTLEYENTVYFESGDIDADGDDDFVICNTPSEGDLTFSWFRNNGGSFTQLNIYSDETAVNASCVRLGDLDNDGYLDVGMLVGTTEGNPFIAHFDSGSGNFTDIEAIVENDDLNFAEGRSLQFMDADEDGDLDIFHGVLTDGFQNGQYYISMNEGNREYSTSLSANSDQSDYYIFYTDDVDSDGDIDFLGSSLEDERIFWLENLGFIISVEENSNLKAVAYPNPSSDNIQISNAVIGASYVLLDINGRNISTGLVLNPALDIDLTNVPAGKYFVRFSSDSGYQETLSIQKNK